MNNKNADVRTHTKCLSPLLLINTQCWEMHTCFRKMEVNAQITAGTNWQHESGQKY